MNREELKKQFEEFMQFRKEFENFRKLKEKLDNGMLTIEGNVANDIQLIDKLLTVVAATKGVNLRDFTRRVLKYYLKYGYNDEAKKYILEDYMAENGVTNPTEKYLEKIDQRIRTANVHLRDEGFLLHGTTNQRKSRLSDEMERLRKKILDNNHDYILVKFNGK